MFVTTMADGHKVYGETKEILIDNLTLLGAKNIVLQDAPIKAEQFIVEEIPDEEL
jgi:hypothetical protein